jgi:aromatic-L-amino-acid decarboxylase
MDDGAAPRPSGDPLGLPEAEMRRLGYWMVDQVVEHFQSGADGPAVQTSSPAELRAVLGGPPPIQPGDPQAAMQLLVDVALANMQHGDHPRYFSRVPGPASFAGVLGEWLGTGFNAIAASWKGGSGPATVELVVLDWLRSLLGMPEGGEGVLASGGSLANTTAMAAARRAGGDGVAYLSDQTHSSIARGLLAMGFAPEMVRVIGTGDDLRLTADLVAAQLAGDRVAGRRPGFVVATAGATNTGGVDDLVGLSDLCAVEGMWFHVDGAYGGPAALCDRGRRVLAGIDRADSLVLDPHKWLFQPYDVGCLLVRRPGVLDAAFHMTPEYLLDVRGETAEVDFRNRSLELSRRSRALKIWLTFHTYGLERIAAAIEQGILLAETAERMLVSDARFELVTPAQLGIVTFALRGASHEQHTARAEALGRGGYAAVTTTRLHRRSVLRLCTINPRTGEDDIAATLERLATQTG